MPQGKRVSKDTESLIIEMIGLPENQGMGAPALAERVRGKLQDDKERVPHQTTIEKRIRHFRELASGAGDQVWNLGVLDNFPPPQALPVVLFLWERAQEKGYPLSVRMVKWISRLYACYGDLSLKNPDSLENLLNLEFEAKRIANLELISEITKSPLNWREIGIHLYERTWGHYDNLDRAAKEKLRRIPKRTPQKIRYDLADEVRERGEKGGKK